MSISDAMYTALSGLQAASAALNLSASNVANMQTPGYKALRANLTSLPNNGGVQVSSITADPSQGPIDQYGQQSSNVDLSTEIVGMSMAKHLYDANAAVLKVSSEMTGTLLDIFDTNHRH